MIMDVNDKLTKCSDFCKLEYSKHYAEYIGCRKCTNDLIRAARKYSIQKTLEGAMKKFPDLGLSEIWKFIYSAHIYKFTGLDFGSEEVIQNVISAEQSWRKSSGHAFEAFVKDSCNIALEGTDIVVLLQKDLTEEFNRGTIINGERDKEWLQSQKGNDIFDLYVALKDRDCYFIFGCVQAKTSIRDRVTRDREPSMIAMEASFWSTIFILDAEYLIQPKFKNMVNGNSNEFKTNGWHAAYTFTNQFEEGRIHYIGLELTKFVEDAQKAKRDFTGSDRSWYKSDWDAG